MLWEPILSAIRFLTLGDNHLLPEVDLTPTGRKFGPLRFRINFTPLRVVLALTYDFLPLEVRFRFLKVKVDIWSLRVEFSPSGLSLGIW